MKKIYGFIGVIAIVCIGILLFIFMDNSNRERNPISSQASVPLVTTKLANIPDSYYQALLLTGGVAKNFNDVSFSSNYNEVAFVVKQNSESSVYLNNTPGPSYQYVELPAFAFSTSGNHYVYEASNASDTFVVLDGKEQKHYPVSEYSINSMNLFVDSSGTVAYELDSFATTTDNRIVFNGYAGDLYDSIFDVQISLDGSNVTYYGCTNDDETDINSAGSCIFVTQNLDGTSNQQEGLLYSSDINQAIYNSVSQYSPDGKILAHSDDLGLMVNGIQTYNPGNLQDVHIKQVSFSPDGKDIAYIAQDCGPGSRCIVNNLGYEDGGAWYIVLDGNVLPSEYDEIRDVTFNNADDLAYFARNGNKWSFINGSSTYNLPTDMNSNSYPRIVFSADDQNYLYTYIDTNGKTHLVVNGTDTTEPNDIYFPEFTSNDKVIFMSATNDTIPRYSMSIGGIIQSQHDNIFPLFSSPTSEYQSVYQFTSDGKVVYGAIDGSGIYRVVEAIN